MLLFYIAIGGAFGSVCRYLLMSATTQLMGREFPYGTLLVNLFGSFLLGLLVGVIASILPRGRELHALLAVGFLGGFTTFSTFAMDVYLLSEREPFSAMLYTACSVGLSVVAFFLGMWCFREWAW